MNINKAYAREMVSWNHLLGKSAIRKHRGFEGAMGGLREPERQRGQMMGRNGLRRTQAPWRGTVSPFLPETVILAPKAVGTRSLGVLTILHFSECQ